MLEHAWPPERPVLVATSDGDEAVDARAALGRAGRSIALVDDPVDAMHALCARGETWAGLIAGDRVGRLSGLSLCGLARDAGLTLPALLLTHDPCATVAIRAARLRVTVLWLPASAERLARTIGGIWARRGHCAVGSK